MASIKNFEEIIAWQKARELNKLIKELTSRKEFSTDYELKKQIVRSSGSIMDNIAEGFERQGNNEFIYFLYVAKGSCGELRSQAYRAIDYGYISKNEFDKLFEGCVEVSRILNGLIDSIRTSGLKGYKFKTT